MNLKSSTFQDNQQIPSKYTCGGEDINPPLTIEDIPDDAKSLVLIVDDPDAPGGNWVHWIVFNIDPKITEVKEGKTPENSDVAVNSWGSKKYQGPCPPSGTHRYQFRLYALDTTLKYSSSLDKGEILKAIEGRILAESILTGLYSRK